MTGDEVWQSDVILKVNARMTMKCPAESGTTLISFIWPAQTRS